MDSHSNTHSSQDFSRETQRSSKRSRPMGKRASAVFSLVALLIMVLPAASFIWPGSIWIDPTSNTADPPSAVTNQKINPHLLSDAGDYFDAHFPARGAFINVTALAKAGLFHSSSTDQTIIGKDGYLYYSGTLDDYLGFNQLSDRGIANAAYNLKLVQDSLEVRGINMLVSIAPNKATLYSQFMPDRYQRADQTQSNLVRMQNAFAQVGVNHVDVRSLLADETEVLYQKTDTHWNYKGAYLAADAYLQALGVPNVVTNPVWEPSEGFIGDIADMLTPGAAEKETNWQISGVNDGDSFTGTLWHFIEAKPDTAADFFQTAGAGDATLFMFRDSFGNSLVPMLSPSFGLAYYSKLVPYDLEYAVSLEPDVVMIERAERNIKYFATDPAAMPSPVSSLKPYILESDRGDGERDEVSASSAPSLKKNGNYVQIDGVVPTAMRDTDVAVFARVTVRGASPSDTTVTDYRGYRTSLLDSNDTIVDDYGYRFYFIQDDAPEGASVHLYAVSSTHGTTAQLIGSAIIGESD